MSALLDIRDLQAGVDGQPILNGLSLSINAGEVHAIMGPNGSGKSTLSYVLAGRDGYDIEGGDMVFDGQDLTALEPEERAMAGLFLAFQYPLEIPGVTNMTFLKTSVNAIRRGRGEEEMDAASFLRLARDKAKALGMGDDMLKRQLNVGFSGGEKKRNEIMQMAMLEP
jgi:Fe-S cluster assembly ATP-binding protein